MSAPWFKFYPSAWRADPALRKCSIAARGLWMDMLCIMHEAEPYGFLTINGKPVDVQFVARLSSIGLRSARRLMHELEAAGVFSRDEAGTIFSRRMLRDKAKEEADREHGKRGGNPKIVKGVNPTVKAARARLDNLDIDSSLRSESNGPSPGGEGVDQTAVAAYSTLARKIGLPEIRAVSETRKRKLAAILRQHGIDAWNQALAKLEASAFCRGSNDRGWIANFDFLVQPSSFLKLLEGQFDNRPVRPNGQAPPSWHDAAEEQRQRDSDFLDRIIADGAKKHG